ncbi:PTS cellbiose transporter subunit IIB [Nocardiopsis gilva YIM 90087]|uniref:PTS cellbiose transporter subunit IIB n=1 Tax=Nocardiopsis gilva YIM 90087 TaxID=1235441 RepID=A0A223S4V7_9ACTN|nr:PTS sugar transporter subunit IIB [Nocardiopsis gilva]ASU83141.1 PTS cellbiose transporter subunit IIB [Nocardiopsis gilva YIM 90087]
MDRTLEVLTVCGVGMGSSLMLKVTAEDALRALDLPARVEATDVSSARGMRADVVIGQELHTAELGDLAPIVVTITDFLDVDGLASALHERLAAHGLLP